MKRELKTESLTKYLFDAPKWGASLALMILIGFAVDGVVFLATGQTRWIGLAFSIPAVVALFLTKPFVSAIARQEFTWNRSALLALCCEIFMLLLMVTALFLGSGFAYVFGVGFILAIRLIVLAAVADYRFERMYGPAAIQTFAGVIVGVWFFGTDFIIPAVVSVVVFSVVVIGFLLLFDLPMKRTSGVGAMHFVNAFLAHLTNGSNDLEEYFHHISEYVSVPETTFFFKREGKPDVWFVIPNLHPGPMADVGGSNFPKILHDDFADEAILLVSHGCASHDLNLISNRETEAITKAIRNSLDSVIYTDHASRPVRTRFGTVSILSQKFGDSLLMVTTRSPEMTEDMDYSIGRIVMGESKGRYKNVGFVDAHNCMTAVTNIIYPSTKTGNEFISGADEAMNLMLDAEMLPYKVGVAQVIPPFSRGEGFADMGIITMITEVAGIKTAYILFDGNNVHVGVREILRNAVLGLGIHEVEILTTDSHVVNSVTGRNPIGHAVSASEIIPYVSEAVLKAIEDLSPATGGAATNICEEVEVFGPSRIVQLTSTVNAIVINLLPLATLMMISAFLLIMVVCMIVL
ncbi:MAG TPA: DUF2070 family protein [Methanocorpusculum sp.]|nr:DUF2070 family protein [Methanocorpusculum sp.]HJJ50675.1 DUF2070 family protein [Methanocorpusculum sp.]HKL97822.1 DUF2070 family protein [Methanocorpusculum sp.]